MSKIMWNPETGEHSVFGPDETPPPHWIDHHPDDTAKAGDPKPDPKPHDDSDGDQPDELTKAEIMDALKAGGVEFKAADSKAALAELLIGALKRVLSERGIAYDENETAKGLLAKATDLITAGFREGNLIPVGKQPTSAEQVEGLQVLNRSLTSMFGKLIGENLTDWQVPAVQRTGSVAANSPLMPGSAARPERCNAGYPPTNSRIVWDGSAQTVYFPEKPRDGARMALVKGSGEAAKDSGTLTLDGNGRTIEGAATYTGGVSGRKWLYRGDLADWKALMELSIADECPFPPELDDYWICAIAVRLSPRYGKVLQPGTTETLKRMAGEINARYAQSAPAPSGGFELQTGQQSFENGWYFP